MGEGVTSWGLVLNAYRGRGLIIGTAIWIILLSLVSNLYFLIYASGIRPGRYLLFNHLMKLDGLIFGLFYVLHVFLGRYKSQSRPEMFIKQTYEI